ncbi:MAG TPA: NUDIX domain-containing protein, partial [Pyrinomonadaceae bacterium]
EEIGLEVSHVEIFTARSFKRPRQVEILFRCRPSTQGSQAAQIKPLTMEVERAEWFSVQNLPDGLPNDQRLLIDRATTYGANGRD